MKRPHRLAVHRPVFFVVLTLVAVAGALVFARAGTVRAEGVRAPSVAPAPYFVKTAASLADLEKTLQGKGAHSGDLLKPGATAVEIVWRHEEDYEQKDVELHDGKDHVFFVTEGSAAFTLGGQLVEPREISPGEWRAAKSSGSEVVQAAKGDLIFIPHGTVHSRSAKGRRFTMLQLSFWPGGAPAPRAATPAGGPAPGSGAGGAAMIAPPPVRPVTKAVAKPAN